MAGQLIRSAEFSRRIKNDFAKWNLALVKMLMQVAGLWCQQDNKYVVLWGYLITFNWALIVIFQIRVLINPTDNISNMIETFSQTMAIMQGLFKLLSAIIYKKQFKALIERIWNDMLPVEAAAKTEARKRIIFLSKFNRRMIYCLTTFFFSVGFLFFGFPSIIGDRSFSVFILLPFNIDKSPIYELVYVWQFFVSFLVTIFVVSYDLLFVTIIFTCLSQFEILCSNLRLIGTSMDEDKIKFIQYFSEDENAVLEETLDYRLLSKCIQQHNLLTRFCRNVEKVFSYVILVQLLSSMLSICFSSFAAIKYPENRLLFVILPLVTFMELCLYCFLGQELTDSAAAISDAAYESNWYDTSDIKLRKALILIIQRGNEEILLTAGGFARMTLNTLVQVLKFSWSVYTLLDTIVAK